MNSRIKWNSDEQEMLRNLKEVEGIESWKKIAELLNKKFEAGDRTGKQCRQRYINYVRFSPENEKSVDWTQYDDEVFSKLYLEYGPKWSHIVKLMPNKSENCLKNRFYGGLRRIIRKINKVEKIHKVRKTKPIRYETLIRVLDYECDREAVDQENLRQATNIFDQLIQLKEMLLRLTWDLLNGIEDDDEIIELIKRIHEFNGQVKKKSFKSFVKPANELSLEPQMVPIEENILKQPMIESEATEAPTTNAEEALNKKYSILQQKMEEEKKIMDNLFQDFELDSFIEVFRPTRLMELDEIVCHIQNREYIPSSYEYFF